MTTNAASINDEERTVGPSIVFPLKLHKFLHDVEKYNLSHIASWQPHGRCFQVHDQNEFVSSSTSRWFQYKKYESFQRQLNIYGFKRIRIGVDKNCYYHKDFIRGEYLRAQGINRVPIKKVPVRSSTCHAAPIPALDARITHPVLATSSSRIAEARNYDISSNIFNRDINPIESTQMYDPQLLSSQLRDASQSTLQQETTPLQSSAQYTDVDNTINRYIRHTLLNNVPTPRSNIEDLQILSLQLHNISRLVNLPQLNDTDASRRSVLHQLHNTVNQSATDPFILSLLSSTTSPPLPHQEPTMLSQFPSERGNAFMNLASLPTLSGIDPSVLLLILAAQNGVERNHVHQSHSGPSILPQLEVLEQPQFRASVGSHNRTFLTSITAAVQPLDPFTCFVEY